MAFFTFSPETSIDSKKPPPSTTLPKRRKKEKQKQQQPSSWNQIKSLLTCKSTAVHDPSKIINNNNHPSIAYSKLASCRSSFCNFKDVVHGNTRVVHRADNSPENSTVGSETALLRRKSANGPSSLSSSSSRSLASSNGTYMSSSSRGMQFRKLSGCYECHMSHMIVDPSRYPIPRTTICGCPECGEVFPKIESLELHQAVRHAVSELGPEDSGRNIVEIIFKSSWLKRDKPFCNIERILKVHNTKRTIQRFEDCRDAVKIRATSNVKKNPRCAADGNELLRFHCTGLACSLGARGASNLCGSVPGCAVCTIIRHGFPGNSLADGKGVRTTASSGRAHDCFSSTATRRAMLVCRVIAGRVKRAVDEAAPDEDIDIVSASTGGGSSYDSVAGYIGAYSNTEELYVYNPRAILPCFVVIYKTII